MPILQTSKLSKSIIPKKTKSIILKKNNNKSKNNKKSNKIQHQTILTNKLNNLSNKSQKSKYMERMLWFRPYCYKCCM